MAYLCLAGLAAAGLFLWLYLKAATELAALKSRLEAEREAAQDKIRLLDQARQNLKETFAAASADALQANSDTFLRLAQAELDAKRGAIEKLVEPLKESLT